MRIKKEWPMNLLEDIMETEQMNSLPKDFRGSLEYVLHSLPSQKSVEALRLCYQQHMTYEEIGVVMGVSQNRVGQMIENVKCEIKNPFWGKYLQYGVQGVIEQHIQLQKELHQQKVETEVRKTIEAEQQAKKDAEEAERYKSLPIEDRILLTELNLDARVQTCLRRSNLKTVGDLLRLDYSTFAKIRNSGKTTREIIITEVEKLGFDCDHLKNEKNV